VRVWGLAFSPGWLTKPAAVCRVDGGIWQRIFERLASAELMLVIVRVNSREAASGTSGPVAVWCSKLVSQSVRKLEGPSMLDAGNCEA